MCRNGDGSQSFCNSLKDLKYSGNAYYALDTIGVFCASCSLFFSLVILCGHNIAYRGTYEEMESNTGCKQCMHKRCVPSKHVFSYQIVVMLFLFGCLVCLIASILEQVSTDIFLYYFTRESATMTWKKAEGGSSIYLNVAAIFCCLITFLILACLEIYRKDEMDNNDLTPFGQVQEDCKQCISCLTCQRCRKSSRNGNKTGDTHEYETPGDGSDDEDRRF
ncbi:hypothetical protein RFI_23761 [Reticulomyxa filosa]|uniref:Uncharacterized protein n=1 Tax=Reticulomyxa filosa TaxID=46433 RepID=X6MJI6_RETFI|nr:hypothetical protein RFI_23761 [Reticulomyxa filosa]|eukprot:ETO13607.1 hypothetical protein RFI_23761 [Reticulomyxa filosa]